MRSWKTDFVIAPVMALVVAFAPSVAYAAADSVVMPKDLDAALANRLSEEDRSRAAVRDLLDRREVVQLAQGLGIDLRSAHSAVGTLDGAELEQFATQALAIDADRVGGQNITMTLTVFLLVLILVILIVK